MEQRTRVGNRLLAALPTADLDLLVRHFRLVELERDAVLVRSGDPTERLYFPLSGLIAFIMDMPNGQTVATAIVGNEGAVGVLSTLGPTRSPMTAVVRVAGLALQISPTSVTSSRPPAGRTRRSATCWRWDFAGTAISREAQPSRCDDWTASPMGGEG